MKLTSSSGKSSNRQRAEETRQRRTATTPRSDSTRKATTGRATRNVVVPNRRPERVTPGVIVRGMGLGTPVVQKARNKARRQFYYSLGNTGAEVRLPSVPLVKPGWRILSGLLVLVLMVGIWFAYNNPMFQVSTLEITGIERLSNKDILQVVDVANRPIFTVNPGELKTALEAAFPELADVQVTVGMPAIVAITAVERQPAILWKFGEERYWIDGDGYIFEPRGEANTLISIEADTAPPVITPVVILDLNNAAATKEKESGEKTPEPVETLRRNLDPVVLKAALALSKVVPAGTSLTYSAKNGMGWADSRGWNVFVGVNLDQMDQKLKVYEAVVNKLTQDGITPVMISVENLHAPFYRLEQ